MELSDEFRVKKKKLILEHNSPKRGTIRVIYCFKNKGRQLIKLTLKSFNFC